MCHRSQHGGGEYSKLLHLIGEFIDLSWKWGKELAGFYTLGLKVEIYR